MAKVGPLSKRVPKRKNRHTFQPGHPKFGGRKKGTPNKFNGDVKAMVLAALDKVGGVEWFTKQARRNPRIFGSAVVKMIPQEVTGKDGGPIEVLVERAQASLANLSDAELKQLQTLLSKAGVTQ